MRVKDVSKITGLTDSTIRYYEKEGLLLDVKRTNNGYREYDDSDIESLVFIKKARNLGFNLNEIREIILLKKNGGSTCEYVTSHMRRKIEEIDREINRLKKEREDLVKHLIEGDSVCFCQGNFCHYIEGLEE
ncbi:MerR family transcriptional regulator [Lagierella sp.]|uniref:MerR family transcriptional regulator n=1 Tax=Lagierella sp. TaxID=2849657 RepID=UPI002603AA2F|nr:MerR family transcriptional regulator [Lagierella sp.]